MMKIEKLLQDMDCDIELLAYRVAGKLNEKFETSEELEDENKLMDCLHRGIAGGIKQGLLIWRLGKMENLTPELSRDECLSKISQAGWKWFDVSWDRPRIWETDAHPGELFIGPSRYQDALRRVLGGSQHGSAGNSKEVKQ